MNVAPCVLPCPLNQEHQSTREDSGLHRIPENWHQPLGCDNALWLSDYRSLRSNPICNASLRKSPHVYSLSPRLRKTIVSLWIHESIGYSKWTSAVGTQQRKSTIACNVHVMANMSTKIGGCCSFALVFSPI